MSTYKIEIYNSDGSILGHILSPELNVFSLKEYEIKGVFYDTSGNCVTKVDFNPEAIPYCANLQDLPNCPHKYLTRVYIQKGRQPIVITGQGIDSLPFLKFSSSKK